MSFRSSCAIVERQGCVNKSFLEDSGIMHDPASNLSKDSSQEEKIYVRINIRRNRRNLILFYLGMLLTWTGVYGLLNVSTSIIKETDLIKASLTALGAAQFGGCLLVPPVQHKFNTRTVLILCAYLQSLAIVPFFYPHYWTLIPGFFFMGIAWTLGLAANSTYIRYLSVKLAYLTSTDPSVMLVRNFAILGVTYNLGLIIGNLFIYVIFVRNFHGIFDHITIQNESLTSCGIKYCNENVGVKSSSSSPESWQILTLIAVLSGCALLAAFVIHFLDPVHLNKEDETNTEKVQFCTFCMSSFRDTIALWKDKRQLLLIPYSIYRGLELPFIMTDFTKAFLSCALGISNIGRMMICFGLISICFGFLQPYFVRFSGRLFVVFLGGACHCAAISILFYWRPIPNELTVFFAATALLGITDSSVFAQLWSLHGIHFQEKSKLAYSNCTFFVSLGYTIAYVYGYFIDIRIKIHVITAVHMVALVCYLILELKIWLKDYVRRSE